MMEFILQEDACSLAAASYYGHLDVVKTLIKAGANINQAKNVSIPVHTATVYDIIACDHYISVCSVCVTKQHTQQGVVCRGDGG